MTHTLINLLGWVPGYSGFSSYGRRVLSGLSGPCLVYDGLANSVRVCDLSDERAAEFLKAQPLSQSHGFRSLLQRYGLLQFTANLRAELNAAGLDPLALAAIYSPFSDYLFAFPELPQILTCHDLTPLVLPNSRKAWLYYRFWIPRQLHRATRVIAISHFVADQLMAIGIPSNRICVIPNGISLDAAPLSSPLGPDILMLARHQRNKNVPLVLRAIQRLQLEYPGRWQGILRIVGRQGRDTAAVQRLRRELPIPAQVELVESLSPAALDQARRRSLALISSSLMEGCDYPVLEACAVGLPSLVSRIPVHQELYARCSLLFSVSDDGVELCHQILRLLQEPQLWTQLSKQSLLTAQEFSLSRQHTQLQDQIAQVIQ